MYNNILRKGLERKHQSLYSSSPLKKKSRGMTITLNKNK